MTDYLSLVWIACLFGGLVIGAVGTRQYYRWRYRSAIAMARHFNGGLHEHT